MKGVKTHRGVNVQMWTDDKFVRLSPLARLLWIGSWHYCCDAGHLGATKTELKIRVLPADNCDVEALFAELLREGVMVGDEETGYTVPKLPEHQKIDKRWALTCSRCPREEGADEKGSPHEDHARSTRGAREGHKSPRAEVVRSEVKGSEGGAGGRTKAAKRGSRLPDIFPITEQMREWGRENCPGLDASREHEKFCDYWRGVSGQRGVKVDWVATWRNWMRRAHEDHAPAATSPASSLPDWMRA